MSSDQKAARATGRPGLKIVFFLVLLLGILLSGLPAQEEDEEEVTVFKGAGIHVRLNGGYCLYSGGDFKTGTQGMFDWGANVIVSNGFTLGTSNRRSLDSGYEFGGDVIYYFAGRLGIGVGGSLTRVNKLNEQYFRMGTDPHDFSMRIVPQLDILSFRLGLFYEIPVNRLLTISLNIGPAYYSADYTFSMNITEPNYQYVLSQGTKAKNWGAQGGIGLEIRMNQRLEFVLEAQGRYAKISGFDGKEQLYEYLGGPISTSEKDGPLYYLEKEGFPRLEIFPEPPASGFNYRQAVFDFSGVSFRGGLNFKF
jgi:hypothetical protein